MSDRLKVGIGTYGNFGLAMDFGDSWAGRNLVGEMALIAMTVQPTAAYRLDDHWSLGAGLTANYGDFKLEREPLDGDTRSQMMATGTLAPGSACRTSRPRPPAWA